MLDIGVDINLTGSDNETALFMAAGTKNDAMVAFLLEKGADVNLPDNQGTTPLHRAAMHTPLTAPNVRLLANKRANVNVLDKDSR